MIILVEKNEDIAEMLVANLSRKGIEMKVFNSAADAEIGPRDIVFMDLKDNSQDQLKNPYNKPIKQLDKPYILDEIIREAFSAYQ